MRTKKTRSVVRKILPSLTLFGALIFSVSAHANLVSDPGFEVENASSGPVTASPFWNFSGDAGIDNANPNAGSNDAFLGNGSLSQTLSTLAGATYSVGFYLAADKTTIDNAWDYDLGGLLGLGNFNASVTVNFDGNQLDQILADNGDFSAAGSYFQFSYTPAATTNSAVLALTGSQSASFPGTWYVDDVSVSCTANCALPTTPLPSSALLLASGLGALFGFGAFGIRKKGAQGLSIQADSRAWS